MKFLDQFISRTGRQPAEWTSQDIQNYVNYVKAQVTDGTGGNRYDACSPVCSENGRASSMSPVEAVRVPQ